MRRRVIEWTAAGMVLLACLVLSARWWRAEPEQPEDPLAILESLVIPPAPVLSPQQSLETLRVAPGYRVELVAAEPLVEDPVWLDWDDEGRLYVAEMRGYMPNLEGQGEDVANGRVVVLEDRDGDGAMDSSEIFLDALVLPRSLRVVPQGVLIAEPPNLWLCRDTEPADGKTRCDEKLWLGEYGAEGNVEHRENGLLPALDNWIYNAKSARRFRLRKSDGGEVALDVEATAFRGQWGIAQDDRGRLLHNHNSEWILIDEVRSQPLERHPATDPRVAPRAGLGTVLTAGQLVNSVRVNPGVNRAYVLGTLREDGRLAGPTSVAGLAVQRSSGFGAEERGSVFVPETAANAVAHFRLRNRDDVVEAEHVLYDDADWEKREFLVSTDERFRPANAFFSPDGDLFVVDMYRGVIQHATYVSDYLDEYVRKQGLEEPLGLGRIYRVTRAGRAVRARPAVVSDASTAERVVLLDDDDGWWRDRAQQALVVSGDPQALPLLRALPGGPLGRLHAIWTLEGLGALDRATWRRALEDEAAEVVVAALQAGAPLLRAPEPGDVHRVQARLAARERDVRLGALLALGEVPARERPLAAMMRLADRELGDEVFGTALVSGIGGVEREVLDALVSRSIIAASPEARDERRKQRADLLARVARAAFVRELAEERLDRVSELLDWIDALPEDDDHAWSKLAVLGGVSSLAWRPGFERVELPARPQLLFEARLQGEGRFVRARRKLRRVVTWKGDEFHFGLMPLSEPEKARMERGAVLYAETCQLCHQAHGQGQPGLAPSLVGASWVLDSDDWLLRIILQGVAGPIEVAGQSFDSAMPGHRADPRFADDEKIAGLVIFLRRSWGNSGDPITPETVTRVRHETADRSTSWSARELAKLPVETRLDRYEGSYKLDAMPLMRLRIERDGASLSASVAGMGGGRLVRQPDGSFSASDPTRGDFQLSFIENDARGVVGLQMLRAEGVIEWKRVE